MTRKLFYPGDVAIFDHPSDDSLLSFNEEKPDLVVAFMSRRLQNNGLMRAITAMNRKRLHNFFTLLASELSESPALREDSAKFALDRPDALAYSEPYDDYPWPSAKLNTDGHRVPDDLKGQKMAIVGDGPAGILMARLRTELGYDSEATLLFSPGGQAGGIWNKRPVLDEGHNTFRQATAFGETLRTDIGRPGVDLQDFLRAHVKASRLTSIRGTVDGVEWSSEDGKYHVKSKSSQGRRVDPVDAVLICTGNAIPKPLDSGPIETNVSDYPEVLAAARRWQQTYKPESIESDAGQRPLFIGLGNSTLGMLRQFYESDRQVGVPTVLTHYPSLSLLHPGYGFYHKGKVFMPLQRRPSDLTGLALDIPRLEKAYFYAQSNWIIPGVQAWNIRDYRPASKEFLVEINSDSGTRREWFDRLHILIGYQNDPAKMAALGLKVDQNNGELSYDGFTHQAKTNFEGDPKRVYVAGVAARKRGRPNEEVIPGMMRTLPRIALTDIAAAYCSKFKPQRN